MSTRATMIPRRHSSSYAAVVSGQARPPPPGELIFDPMFTPDAHRRNSMFACDDPPTAVPSYLQNSAYAERLHENNSSVFSAPASPPLSPGSPVAHRGLAYHVLERPPKEAKEEEDEEEKKRKKKEELPLLPTRWSDELKSKAPSLELLNGGAEAKFIGAAKNDTEAASVRADRPIPPQCGLFYWEVTIVSRGREAGFIGIGFCTDKMNLQKLPGWEKESWGYHGDDGNLFNGEGSSSRQSKKYGPKFTQHDIIGCGVNFRTHTAFFTKNGTYLGEAWTDLPQKKKLYPVVGMKKPGEHVRVNFGQDAFAFDIDDYMRAEKARSAAEISRHSTASICPPLSETDLIQSLVSQYLAHSGYADTARAFTQDAQSEAVALDGHAKPSGILKPLDAAAGHDAVNRQRIRTAILTGDIDRALKLTSAYYPKVLQNNEHLHFRLRRRKLIEMIRSSNAANLGNPPRSPDDMDLDDKIDVQPDAADPATLAAAVEYGRELGADFNADGSPSLKAMLQEAFSLIAYPNPGRSCLGHLLDEEERVREAEEVNAAILESQGVSPVSALEMLVKQSTALVEAISEDGGSGAFVNVRGDYLRGGEN